MCAGSHVDTVLDGGAFDGALGVVAALVAVEAVRRDGPGPRRPLAVGCMVDEEGPRFDAAIFGSRMLCGELDIEPAARADRPRRPHAARARRCARGHRRVAGGRAGLARAGRACGSRCTSSRASRSSTCPPLSVSRAGSRPASAGVRRSRGRRTTPGHDADGGPPRCARRRGADDRRRRGARRAPSPEPSRRSGASRRVPARRNVIPGESMVTLDVRARDRGGPRPRARRRVRGLRQHGRGRGVVEPRVVGRGLAVRPRPARRAHARRVAISGSPRPTLWAYAGHDAGVLARRVPAAMLFVRNPTGRLAPPGRARGRGRLPGRMRGARERARRARLAVADAGIPHPGGCGIPGPVRLWRRERTQPHREQPPF